MCLFTVLENTINKIIHFFRTDIMKEIYKNIFAQYKYMFLIYASLSAWIPEDVVFCSKRNFFHYFSSEQKWFIFFIITLQSTYRILLPLFKGTFLSWTKQISFTVQSFVLSFTSLCLCFYIIRKYSVINNYHLSWYME